MSSFFQKPPQPNAPVQQDSYRPPATPGRGDRTLGVRVERDQPPEHRKKGLNNQYLIERVPRGCLFKVGSGFFDLDGYWCLPKVGGVEVRRGASRKVNAQLTKEQKWELARVRLQARRKGVR